jgi:hypothetical protein
MRNVPIPTRRRVPSPGRLAAALLGAGALAAGGTTASAAAKPSVVFTSPVPAATIATTAGKTKSKNKQKCVVKATSKKGIKRVEFYVGGKRFGKDVKAPYRCNWRTYEAKPGRYVLKAKATDNAGDVAWTKVVIKVAGSTVPASAPTAPASTPASTDNGDGGRAPVGISASLRYADGSELRDMISKLRSNGLEYSREDLKWNLVETRRGSYDWSMYDDLVVEAARQDLGLILIPNDPPSWVSADKNSDPPSEGSDLDGYAAFVKAAVARYGTNGTIWSENSDVTPKPVTQWDIWNEPYQGWTWGPGDPNGGQYARMFKAAAVAGKQADANAQFMFEGDTGANTGRWPQPAWFEQAFAAVPDLANYLDAVSIHPYTMEDNPTDCTPSGGGLDKFWYETRFQFCRVKDVRKILDAHGAKGAKLWITELGWATAGDRSVSEATQAKYVHDVFRQLRQWKIVDGIVWYHYMTAEDTGDREQWFGFVHPDGSPKPAWNALVDEARTGVPT